MKVYIDQSGKIEDTNKLTIVAFANKKAKTLMISSVEKQKLMKTMRILDHPKKTFIYKAFAGLVFLLLRGENIKEVIIDKEYPGHEPLIKDILLQLFKKNKLQTPYIEFKRIGKQSQAHKIALETFRGERKPDKVVKAVEVLILLYKKKKGWSPHS